MTTTYHIPAAALDQIFLDRIKSVFRDGRIVITISDEDHESSLNEVLNLQGKSANQDLEEMKRALDHQKNISPEKIKSYQASIQALRGVLKGIDTTVERDADRV